MSGSTARNFWIKLSIVGVGAGVGVVIACHAGVDWSHGTPQGLRARILAWGAWAPLGYILSYSLRVFLCIPASLITLTGGLLFGPWWGTLYTVVGATICAAIEFGLARWVGRETIERWLAGRARLARLDATVGKRGLIAVLLIRLIPSVPFDVLNVSLGLGPVRWRDYLLGTSLGMVPWTIAFGFMGEALTDWRNLWKVLGGLAALILVIWTPWLWRRYRAHLAAPRS